MFDDELGSTRVAHERPRAGIVHGIGEIAGQDDVESEPCHLADAKPAVKDADVGMYSHERDVGDTFLFEEVVNLLSALAYAVEANDVDGRVLARPGIKEGRFPLSPRDRRNRRPSHQWGSCAPPWALADSD